MEPVDEIKSELESFREQWRAEVRAKQPGAASASRSATQAQPQLHGQTRGEASSSAAASAAESSRTIAPPKKPALLLNRSIPKAAAGLDDDYGSGLSVPFDEPSVSDSKEKGVAGGSSQSQDAPQTALEHFEKAVESEAQGKLGESLNLYRQAFRVCPATPSAHDVEHGQLTRWTL